MRSLTYVFIAGPYGRDGYLTITRNIARAREAAAFLANNAIPFFCPHLNSAYFEYITPDVPVQFWNDLDLAVLDHASAVWLLDGWETSKGTLVELDRAKLLRIPSWLPAEGDDLVQWWHS